jgi:hypothetical protein
LAPPKKEKLFQQTKNSRYPRMSDVLTDADWILLRSLLRRMGEIPQAQEVINSTPAAPVQIQIAAMEVSGSTLVPAPEAPASAPSAPSTLPPVSQEAASATSTSTPLPHPPSVLSDADLQIALAMMKKNIGGRLRVLWRLKPARFVENDVVFKWSNGTIHGLEEGVFHILLDEANQDSDVLWVLYEFPHPEVEYADIKLVRDNQMPKSSRVREREVPVAAASLLHTSSQMTALTQAIIDGKGQKASQYVEGGELLRIPATIQAKFHCLYPTVWWERRVKGEDSKALCVQLEAELLALRIHLGAAQPAPDLRDLIACQATFILNCALLPLSCRPKNLDEWVFAFTAPLEWLRLVLTVAHGSQAADAVHASALLTIRKPGMLDLADLIITVEENATKVRSSDFRLFPTSSNQLKQLVANAVSNATQETQAPRGRGRGGWRGRRGGV